MQALTEGLLPQSCAAQQGAALFKRLKQLWSAQAQPVIHAQVLLLQAHLPGLLGSQDTAMSLVQQALALLAGQQVSPPPPHPPFPLPLSGCFSTNRRSQLNATAVLRNCLHKQPQTGEEGLELKSF